MDSHDATTDPAGGRSRDVARRVHGTPGAGIRRRRHRHLWADARRGVRADPPSITAASFMSSIMMMMAPTMPSRICAWITCADRGTISRRTGRTTPRAAPRPDATASARSQGPTFSRSVTISSEGAAGRRPTRKTDRVRGKKWPPGLACRMASLRCGSSAGLWQSASWYWC